MSTFSPPGEQGWEEWAAQLPLSSVVVVRSAIAQQWGGGSLPPNVEDRSTASGYTLAPQLFAYLRSTDWLTSELDTLISERAAGTGFSGQEDPLPRATHPCYPPPPFYLVLPLPFYGRHRGRGPVFAGWLGRSSPPQISHYDAGPPPSL